MPKRKLISDPAELNLACVQLQELQGFRTHFIRHTTRISNSAKGLSRRVLGWRYDLNEKEGKAINSRATSFVDAAFSGKEIADPTGKFVVLVPHLTRSADMHAIADQGRDDVEKDMKALVRRLPISMWSKPILGLGELGLAVLIGETGNPLNYSTKDKFKKRLGLAPFTNSDGVTKACSTWRKEKPGLSAAEWEKAGYKPKRLGEVFGVVTACLIRSQLRTDDETDVSIALGDYGQIYLDYKFRVVEQRPEWTKMRHHMAAARYMTQRLVCDLYDEWHRLHGVQHQPLLMAAE